MHGTDLHWLPNNARWAEQLTSAAANLSEAATWDAFVALARTRLSSLQTMQLDRRRALAMPSMPATLSHQPVRVAVLAASTIDHLLPAIRVGGLRRSIWIDTYTPDYGQYAQELINPASGLHHFRPTSVLFALDAHHLIQCVEPGMTAEAVATAIQNVLDRLETQWKIAKREFSAQVLQTIPLPVFMPLLGNNEHRLASSRLAALRQFGTMLRARADLAGVDLVSLDDRAAIDGLAAWHDPALWHLAKQEIHPKAAPLYGESRRALDRGRPRTFKQVPCP